MRALIQRTEQFMFHKDAFREILLNAVVHKDYSSCNPIQISVYEDNSIFGMIGRCWQICYLLKNYFKNIHQSLII